MNSSIDGLYPHPGTDALSTPEAHRLAQMLGTLMSKTRTGLWDWDIQTDEVVYSPLWEATLGYHPGELERVLRTRLALIHPEDRERVAAGISALKDGDGSPLETEYRMTRKDGAVIWVKDRVAAVAWDEAARPMRAMGMTREVTSVKQAELRTLAEAGHREFAARLAGLVAWEFHLPDDRIIFSDDYQQLLGLSPEEMPGSLSELGNILPSDELEKITNALSDYIDRNEGDFDMVIRVRHKSGRLLHLHTYASIVERGADGAPIRLRGGMLNIDERMRAMDALKDALQENERHNERLQEEIDGAVQQLALSQETIRSMFDANPYPNLLCDHQLNVVDCNPAAIEYFKFPDKETLLKGFLPYLFSCIPPYQADGRQSVSLMDRFQHTIEHGSVEFETELILHGKLTPLNVVIKKISYQDSFALVAYVVDLSAMRDAANELVRQDRILRAVNDCAYLLMRTEEDRPEKVLPEALRLLAQGVNADRAYIWRNREIDGVMCTAPLCCWPEEVTPGEMNNDGFRPFDVFMPVWRQTLLNEKSTNTTVRALREKGLLYAGPPDAKSLLILPIFLQGWFWGFIGFNDCKEERAFQEIEEKLLKAGGMLAASYIVRNEMTDSLITAREAALASTRAKSEFLSRMSHEIRTPMNAIIGMNTIAKKSNDINRIRYCLDKIDDASAQLLGIINDILDISKIEANKFEITPHEFNFEKMIQNVINVIGVKIEEKHQHFSLDFRSILARSMVADELRLSQVLLNLLSNAVKFADEGGNIAVKINLSPLENGNSILHVEVIDDGIGITKEQMGRLFRSFEQAEEGTTRKYGGTGLGLSICKKIVNMMNGDIGVHSEPGEGSTFYFDVEVGWGSNLAEAAEQLKPRDNIRVLVVDDAFDVLDYFKSILSGYSLRCDTSSGGREAIEMVRRSMEEGYPYDIIFLDWNMPGFSGGETARAIRQINSNIIVVMISVADWSDIEEQARALGVTHFLAKPVLPSTLYNTVVTLTEKTYVTERTEDNGVYDWSDKTILLTEDVEINREIIMSILEETGVHIDSAENGREAVDMFAAAPERYQLIMMDVQMPEMDGLEATRTIRASHAEQAKTIPIIAMTANAFKEDVEECLSAGMNDHIAKPINVDEMFETMAKHMGKNE